MKKIETNLQSRGQTNSLRKYTEFSLLSPKSPTFLWESLHWKKTIINDVLKIN